MRKAMEQIKLLLESKVDIIWVNTYEEAEFVLDMTKLLKTNFYGTNLFLWSMNEGMKKIPMNKGEKTEPAKKELRDPSVVMEHINKIQNETIMSSEGKKIGTKNENVFILRDFHTPLKNMNLVYRAVRDVKEYNSYNYNPIIIVAPTTYIPMELEKLIHVVDYDTLDKNDISKIINNMQEKIKMANQKKNENVYKLNTPDEIETIINGFCGLTYKEINNIIAISLKQHKAILPDVVMEHKIQLIKKSGVLDYKIPKAELKDIGGNESFKDWINDVKLARTPEAKQFGCIPPKGYLALGVPGCGKTLLAEALAKEMNVPFIILNLNKVMDSLVGNSEKKIEQALKTVKACAPCVLLADEIEKTLGGINSSNSSDSGTTARVFASILSFLVENEDVFVVMTSNDVSQLPPELTRAGRLDTIFYFSVPTEEERKEIFKIHLNKTGKSYSEETLNTVVSETKNYTGAEIETIVKLAMWKAFRRFSVDKNDCLTTEDLMQSIKEVIPVAESSKEKINYLENWAKGRARFANKVIDENGFDVRDDQELLNRLSDLEL